MQCFNCKKEMRIVKSDFRTILGDIDLTIHNNDTWKCMSCGRKVYMLDKFAKIQEYGYEIMRADKEKLEIY